MMLHVLRRRVLSVSCLLSLASWVVAMPVGFYAGLQGGVSDTHRNIGEVGLTSAAVKSNGLAYRALLGYYFTPYLGTELGYGRFRIAEFNDMNAGGTQGKIHTHITDLALRGNIPFDNGFSLHGKVGVARVKAHRNPALAALATLVTQDTTRTTPVFGLGAAWEFSPEGSVDVFWSRYAQSGSVPRADFLSVGLSGHFG